MFGRTLVRRGAIVTIDTRGSQYRRPDTTGPVSPREREDRMMQSRRASFLVGLVLLIGACDAADGADDSQQPTVALAVPNTGTVVSSGIAVPASTGTQKFDLTKAVLAPRGPHRPVPANTGTGASRA